MWYKLILNLLRFGILVGFIIVIGAGGSSDLELIGLRDLVIRGTTGIVLIVICFIGLKIGGFESVSD